MIIRDTPSDLDKYLMVDGEVGFELQQLGVKPSYIDMETLYFKKSNKLNKMLKKLGYSELLDNKN